MSVQNPPCLPCESIVSQDDSVGAKDKDYTKGEHSTRSNIMMDQVRFAAGLASPISV